MLFESKEEQDLYVAQTIKNLVCDEVAFNTSKRAPIHSWHEFYGLFEEEKQEAQEEMSSYLEHVNRVFTLARMDAPREAFEERAVIAITQGWELMHEVVHMQAVLMKAYKQLITDKNELDKVKDTCHRPK